MIEVKSLDVENNAEEFYIHLYHMFGWQLKSSQRVFDRDTHPKAAFSYENLTYIYSETDEVDYTKLVFERNTHMPNYRRIAELESEFFELMEDRTDSRPAEPPPLMTYSEWFAKTKPSPLSWLYKLVLTLSLAIVFSFFCSKIAGIDWILTVITVVLPLMCVPCYAIVAILNSCLRKAVVKGSAAGTAFQEKYEEYKEWHAQQLENIEFYDYVTARIPELLEELNQLVN